MRENIQNLNDKSSLKTAVKRANDMKANLFEKIAQHILSFMMLPISFLSFAIELTFFS